MRQVTTVSDIKRLGTIMGVWAHPDDETFASAGIMRAAANNGQKIICLTATKGESGVQDEARWPANKLAEIRRQELESALDIIGVQHHHWLDYRDGCCNAQDDNAVGCICEYIEKYKPDTILTFGPEGMTGHPDHKAVCMWSLRAQKNFKDIQVFHAVQTKKQYKKYLKKIDSKLNIYFNIENPPLTDEMESDICFDLPPKIKECKYQALKVMPSQTGVMLQYFDKATICGAFSPEAFIKR